LDPAPAPAAATAAVLQLALDIPEMDGFWHTDVRPERVPLRIAPHPKLPVPLMVDKFGTRVVVEKDAPLQFDAIRIAGDEAHVAYRYEPEGVIAEVELASTGGRWRVVSSDVAER
jgi:hypothetical protein